MVTYKKIYPFAKKVLFGKIEERTWPDTLVRMAWQENRTSDRLFFRRMNQTYFSIYTWYDLRHNKPLNPLRAAVMTFSYGAHAYLYGKAWEENGSTVVEFTIEKSAWYKLGDVTCILLASVSILGILAETITSGFRYMVGENGAFALMGCVFMLTIGVSMLYMPVSERDALLRFMDGLYY